jgi:hypothetical protein
MIGRWDRRLQTHLSGQLRWPETGVNLCLNFSGLAAPAVVALPLDNSVDDAQLVKDVHCEGA